MDLYYNGQAIFDDTHFNDHLESEIPIQIYSKDEHEDIGFIDNFNNNFITVNNNNYNRECFTFISRPGY
ncbi:hypothetical protein [Longirhabdus pacifica]|uniref:hypothetical protein n=1 Tax=Longirhabdus pacifica TaxID=2305227 RepID=UPI001F0BFB91|nr:hypothetical protein [Longirhabdus pacifica]